MGRDKTPKGTIKVSTTWFNYCYLGGSKETTNHLDIVKKNKRFVLIRLSQSAIQELFEMAELYKKRKDMVYPRNIHLNSRSIRKRILNQYSDYLDEFQLERAA